ncbi:MAG TPA: ABC transporter substrate-binding protein [Pseudoneobacillus sp.]|nr:ABC transporter substrate-binding protein [Pseudoneobacillus sp.]
MKTLNKFSMMFLSLILLFSLAACNSSPSDSDKSKDSSTKKEKVEITFWHVWSDRDAGPIKARVEAFNKSQDEIVVKVLGNQDATKQLTAISGGNPPDIALTYWNNIGPWADAGAIEPLEDYFKKDNFDKNMFIPAALERMVINDQTYGLPFTMSMASKLMYNKKVFEEAGITAPPETMEELFSYAQQLTKRDGDTITQIGFIPDYPWLDNVFWPVVFGGSFYDSDKGEVTPNRSENVRAIEYERKFYDEFGIDQISRFRSGLGTANTEQDPLLTGKLAMMIGWEYDFKEYRGADGPIGVAPFPYPADRPDLKGSGMIGPRGVFIPKNAKNKEAAWTFMKYLLGKDSQIDFSIDAFTIPTVIEALDDPRITENKKTEPMWEFYEAAKSENLQGFPNSVYINQYLQALTEQTEKALKGTISAQEAMDNVKEAIQPLADEVNSK